MRVVFQVGYSDFPAKEYYMDELWTTQDKAMESADKYAGSSVQWELVTGLNDTPVWRGSYTKRGNNYTSYVWVKPMVLNLPENQQKFALLQELNA